MGHWAKVLLAYLAKGSPAKYGSTVRGCYLKNVLHRFRLFVALQVTGDTIYGNAFAGGFYIGFIVRA